MKGFPMRSLPRVKDFLISPKSSTPLFFLQVGNDPLQFSTFFPFYRLQDLRWTLGLAYRGLPSERLAVLLDESMLVLPEVAKQTHTKAHIWRWMSLDIEEVKQWQSGWLLRLYCLKTQRPYDLPLKLWEDILPDSVCTLHTHTHQHFMLGLGLACISHKT